VKIIPYISTNIKNLKLCKLNCMHENNNETNLLSCEAECENRLSISSLCFPDAKRSIEDVLIGLCLAELGVLTIDTAEFDEINIKLHTNHTNIYANNQFHLNQFYNHINNDIDNNFKGERFHWQSPEVEYLGTDANYLEQAAAEYFGLPIRGKELLCCSKESVSFQNLKPANKMLAFHNFLYNITN
jgi:hypothetical protein